MTVEIHGPYRGTDSAVIRESDHACTIHDCGMELRFVRCTDGSWEFDELVGVARVHVEMMSHSSYWLGFTTEHGTVNVNIGAKRAPVQMTGWGEAT